MLQDTIPKLFLRNVQRYGGKVALREKELGIWKEITWLGYYENVRNTAMGLMRLGFETGDKVAILGDNCCEWLYTDLAVQSLHGVAVGIYPTDVAVQVRYVIQNSGAKFVVVKDQEQADKILEIREDIPAIKKVIVVDMKGLRKYKDPLIISFEDVLEAGRSMGEALPKVFDESIQSTKKEDVAIIVYTSGTTGLPKGAMISHKGMVAQVSGFSQVVELKIGDSVVSALPLCHIAERMFSLIFPMYIGYTVNFAESIETLQEDVREISPTVFLNVPRIWEKFHSNIIIKMQDAIFFKRWIYKTMMPIGERVSTYRLEKQHVPFVWKALYGIAYLFLFRALKNQMGLLQTRVFASGAAPLSSDLVKFYHSIGIEIRETYGMTEMSGVSFVAGKDGIKIGTVGSSIPGVKVKLSDDGEILQRGDLVFAGYHGNPDATKDAIKQGWLHTGDVGEIDEDGYLRILDRKKDIIITAGGKNITPSEIENKLKFSPFIKEAIVIGDRRKFLSCLIQIDYENVANWAQNNRIPYTNYRSLAINPDVYKHIQGIVEDANQNFARVETIKKITILEKELDPDDEELTATMKVKRSMIEKKFKDIIDKMY